jgi:hypothetical protein
MNALCDPATIMFGLKETGIGAVEDMFIVMVIGQNQEVTVYGLPVHGFVAEMAITGRKAIGDNKCIILRLLLNGSSLFISVTARLNFAAH